MAAEARLSRQGTSVKCLAALYQTAVKDGSVPRFFFQGVHCRVGVTAESVDSKIKPSTSTIDAKYSEGKLKGSV